MLRRRTLATGLASTLLLAACGQSGIVTPTTALSVAASTTPATAAQPGKLIYGADAAIWQLDLRTGIEKRLSPPANRVGSPALSADGQRLAYTAMISPKDPNAESIRQQLWIHALTNGQRDVALDDAPPGTYRMESAFTPDGRNLLYEFHEASSRRNSIRSLDLATRQSRLLIGDALQPSFSRTGQLAYMRYDAHQKTALWIADGDGSNARQIVPYSADFVISSPRLSPDGSQIVFSARRVATTQQALPSLWIAMADGSSVRELSVGPSNDIGPDTLHCNWYPDGQQIVFADATGIFRLPLTGSQQWHKIGPASGATGLFLTV